MLELKLGFRLAAVSYLSSLICFCSSVESRCSRGCDSALGSYYVEQGNNLTSISEFINTDINTILKYNPNIYQDSIPSSERINVPFSCECINGDFLGHVFNYNTKIQDTYELIAESRYANLTTAAWIQRVNWYDSDKIPDDATLNVTVNCSCGDSSISKAYGLFVTYPLRSGETLDSVSREANLSSDLIRSYNPDADFSARKTLIYIPGRDENGNYPPLRTSSGLSGGAIGGITVAGVLLLAGCIYYGFYAPGGSPGLTSITVDRSVEFSYEELSRATDEFSLAKKIGQGGSGAVYYAELRGEKAAIKKMDMQASKLFLAELKVLTHVHHLNLVADFGLTKLIEVGSTSLHTNPGGTFGYMPPEYTYGEVSPKTDVYAFGVVLYELVSAKEAVVKANGSGAERMGLVSLFNEVLSQPDPKDDLVKMIDPRLGDNYPPKSVHKMIQLARACTQENPQLRPSMKSIVFALMTLLSSTEDLNVG